MAALTDVTAIHRLQQYHDNYAFYEERISKVVAWRQRYDVPVICQEFGTYFTVPPESRFRWLHDWREIYEAHHIPWEIYDYSPYDGFTIGLPLRQNTTAPEPQKLNPDILKALGLDAEQPAQTSFDSR